MIFDFANVYKKVLHDSLNTRMHNESDFTFWNFEIWKVSDSTVMLRFVNVTFPTFP